MPTEKESTAELTPEQKKLLASTSAPIGEGLPAGGKDPANATGHEAFKAYRKREFPDDDKVW